VLRELPAADISMLVLDRNEFSACSAIWATMDGSGQTAAAPSREPIITSGGKLGKAIKVLGLYADKLL
jgi:hypothetical protein